MQFVSMSRSLSLVLLCCYMATTSVMITAFVVVNTKLHTTGSNSVSSVVLFAESPTQRQVSRQSFLSSIAKTTTAVTASVVVSSNWQHPQIANAAKYGGLIGTPSTTSDITPQTADIDTQLLNSSTVKNAIQALQQVRTKVSTVQQTLQNDPQNSVISSSMIGDPYKIRESCNVINTILDEDSQRYTDRLIRGIVQDLVEIDTAALQKEGIPRSTRRFDTVQNKLLKLAKSIDELLAFTV